MKPEQSKRKWDPAYEIYCVMPDGNAVCVATNFTLDEAIARMKRLSSTSSLSHYVFDKLTNQVVARECAKAA